jgi:hypothetical protein
MPSVHSRELVIHEQAPTLEDLSNLCFCFLKPGHPETKPGKFLAGPGKFLAGEKELSFKFLGTLGTTPHRRKGSPTIHDEIQ